MRDFLTQDIHNEILKPTSMFTDEQKAVQLVQQIERRVKQDPASYHALIEELSKYGKHYQPVLKLLEDEYTSHEPHQPPDLQTSTISAASVIDPVEEDKAEIERNNLARIKRRFDALVRKVTDKLKERKPDAASFRQHLTNVFWRGDFFGNSSTVSDFFQVISSNKLWDFYNISSIESIVEEFGGEDTELKVWIEDYKAELTGYKATTRILDYITVCHDEKELADSNQSLQDSIARYDERYCRHVALKLGRRLTQKSLLIYVDELWQSIADHFLIPSLSVLLENIKKGCVEITWLIPELSALQIQYNIQESKAFLRENGIMQVRMDNEILYKEEHPDGEDETDLNERFLCACHIGDKEAAMALLACGVSVDTKDKGETALTTACMNGRIEVVQFLLEHHANVHAQDKDGYTAMHWSCREGYLDIVKLLLLHKASLEAVTEHGITPLMVTSGKGRIEVVQFLLDHGADVHARDKNGETAMHWSCRKGYLNIVKLLLLHEASLEAVSEDGTTPLMWASMKGRIEVVQFLLEQGTNVHAQDEDGYTAMHWSCQKGYLNIVETLLLHGASLEAITKHGWTPLIWACYNGHTDVVQFLLEQGANVHAQHEDGATAMHWSCLEGYLNIVETLLLHGASLEAVTKRGVTPLWFATYWGCTEVVQFLLEQGASVHAQDENGVTAMHQSCQKGHLDIVKLLYSHEASLEAISKGGSTPLMYACNENHVNIVQYLLEQKPSLINTQTESGWTALMVATKNGSLETVKLLLETNPGTIDCREKSTGWTALFIAAKNGHLPILRMLIEYGADIYMKATDDVTSAYDVAAINNQNEVCDELKRHGYQPVAPPTEQMKRGVEHSNKVLTQEFDNMDHMKQFELFFTTRERRESTKKRNYPSLGIYDLEEQFDLVICPT